MSCKLDIIQVGYAHEVEKSKMIASGSCCLVRSGGDKILFDTMGPWEKDKLVEALNGHKIHPDDINYLVCSHSHPDHIGNNNLFTRAKLHLVGTSVYERDIYHLDCFEPTGSYSYTTSKGEKIEVITNKDYPINSHARVEPTPGHTLECVTLFLDNCDNFGSVALAGDLFERKEDVENEAIWLRAGSQSADLQRAHRARVYKRADYIVPGHGDIFQTVSRESVIF